MREAAAHPPRTAMSVRSSLALRARIEAAARQPAGPDAAWLVRMLSPVVRARAAFFARVRRPGGEDVNDLAQHVWLSLFENGLRRLSAWDPEREVPLERYIAMVADRLLASRSQLGMAKRRRGRHVAFEGEQHGCADPRATPEELLGSKVRARAAEQMVARNMSLRGQLAFTSLCLDELPPSSAAQRMGVSVQVVYNWQHKIRNLLADLRER